MEEKENTGNGMRILKILGLVLAFLGVAFVLMGIQADDAEAVPVPSWSGTYSISSNVVWDSGSGSWNGNLYIQSGGTLTMKNGAKGTFSGSYRSFYIYSGGTLIMDGATVEGTQTGWSGFRFYQRTGSQTDINNSVIHRPGYWYDYTYNVKITNSTISEAYYGVYTYSWGGDFSKDGPILTNNLFLNCNYAMRLYTGTPIVKDNLFMGSTWQAIYIANSGPKITNNTFIKNKSDAIYAYNPGSWELTGNVITNNNGKGLYARGSAGAEAEIHDNVLTNNGGADIHVDNFVIRSVNNTIGKVTANNNGQVNVYWLLDVYVEWEDGSGPVADADVTFWDSQDEGIIQDETTGSDGWVRDIEVKEFSWKTGGKLSYSPYLVNASKFDIKASVSTVVEKNAVAKLVLDNVPPTLDIEAPVDKALLNKNLVLVRGLTEPGATCIINFMDVPVAESGWFETYLNLSTDGTHEIKIKVMDPSLNYMEDSRTIIIDTKAPPLTITSPEEGTLTNMNIYEVTAETEPGAVAMIDGKSVVVDSNGRFSRLTALSEGENMIMFEVWDKAGNMNSGNVTIELDTSPPNLVILEPMDRQSVSAMDIKVVGFIEDGSTLKINNMQVRYQAGTFQTSVRLTEGDNDIIVEAWDKAGNYNSKTLTITLDMKPPKLVIITPKDNMFTNQRIILVSGETDIGSKVMVNGDRAEVDPGTGYFEKSHVLKSGNNKIQVISTDRYGNSVSDSVTVILDEDAPDLTLLTPENNTITNQDTIRVEGIAGLGGLVFINGDEVSVDKGKFSTYTSLQEGINEIIVITRDDALNSRSIKVIVIRDSTVDLRVSFPYDGMYTTDDIINVTGSTDINGNVFVNDNLKAPVDHDGKFIIQLSLELGTNDITVVSTDLLGNTASVDMSVTREEKVIEPINRIRPEVKEASAVDGGWMIGLAAFLGIVVGAAVMGGLYFMGRKRQEERTRDQIEDILREREEERAKDGPTIPLTDGAPPVVMPKGYKGPPPHIAPRPARPPTAPPPMAHKSLAPVQGETDAPTDESVVEMHPEIAKCEQRLHEAGESGVDITKPRNSLKLAKFFNAKGDTEKMEKYLRKTNELLENLNN